MLLKTRALKGARPAVSSVCRPIAELADEALSAGDIVTAVYHLAQAYSAFDLALQQWAENREVRARPLRHSREPVSAAA